jgi:hypothetical protein
MSKSAGIDSFFGASDAESLFRRLACRVIEEVETRASRREAAERYGISPARGDLGAAFREDRQRYGKAKRRRHLSAGAARGVSPGSDC